MQKYLKIGAAFLCMFGVTLAHADTMIGPSVQEAYGVSQTFQKDLKQALQQSMKSGGPLKTIEVCHKRAPEIAHRLSQETGWDIRRISLKARNPNNMPTVKERKVLQAFEQKKENGRKIKDLEWFDVTPTKITYMKAIPTHGVCTTCHGKSINPKLQQQIQSFYPNDLATGYVTGDIRGAFVLSKSIDPAQPTE